MSRRMSRVTPVMRLEIKRGRAPSFSCVMEGRASGGRSVEVAARLVLGCSDRIRPTGVTWL